MATKIVLAEAPTDGEIYGGAPMSLLHASTVLVDSIKRGSISGTSVSDISIQKPSNRASLERLLLEKPKLVGLSVTTYSSDNTHAAVENVREKIPETVVVVGGPHYDGIVDEWRAQAQDKKPFSLEEQFSQEVDIVITGDGEFALDRISKIVLANEGRTNLSEVLTDHREQIADGKGDYSIWFRDADGTINEIPSQYRLAEFKDRKQFALDLDELPLPPRELLDEGWERAFTIFTDTESNPLRTAQVKTYRGCDFAPTPTNACSFCYVGSKYKRGGIDRVVDEILELGGQGYEAIFFDDGVFTSRAPRRKKELEAIVAAMKSVGIRQAGFQTRADFLDDDVLQILTEGTDIDWYCSIGVESTEQGMLDSVGKKQSKAKVSHAFDLLEKYGLRIGVYLLFGARGDALGETLETKATAKRTIDFIAEYVGMGYGITSVLPGLDMILPGTKDATSYRRSQYQSEDPLKYGVMHQGDPWDTFEGGKGFHHVGVSEDLVRFIAQYGLEILGNIWEGPRHNDVYIADVGLFQRYREGALRADDPRIIDFNSSMLGKPREDVMAAVRSPLYVADIEDVARTYAAGIVGVKDSRKVVFARNTTEVTALVAAIAGAYQGNVVVTDLEVPSARRVFEQHMDHGNTDKKDAWCSFGDPEVSEEYDGFSERSLTNAELRTAKLLSNYDIDEILSHVDGETNAVLISHVDRHTGRVIDIAEVARRVKAINQETTIIIDGAQALGKLDVVDFEELEAAGVDAYVATPHKNLGSYPLGVGYISKRLQGRVSGNLTGKTQLEQVIMEGMVDSSYGVEANTEVPLNLKRFVSLVQAIDGLSDQGYVDGGDFRRKATYLRELRKGFEAGLQSYAHEVLDEGETSPGILSFRLLGHDQRELVLRLQEQGIFSSYIPEVDAIRVSFETSNSTQEVTQYLQVVSNILGGEKSSGGALPKRRRQAWVGVATGIAAAAAVALTTLVPGQLPQGDNGFSYGSAQEWFTHLQDEGLYADRPMRLFRPNGENLTRN